MTCPNCNANIPEHIAQCPDCGHIFDQPPMAQKTGNPLNASLFVVILGSIAFMILLVTGISIGLNSLGWLIIGLAVTELMLTVYLNWRMNK